MAATSRHAQDAAECGAPQVQRTFLAAVCAWRDSKPFLQKSFRGCLTCVNNQTLAMIAVSCLGSGVVDYLPESFLNSLSISSFGE